MKNAISPIIPHTHTHTHTQRNTLTNNFLRFAPLEIEDFLTAFKLTLLDREDYLTGFFVFACLPAGREVEDAK